MENQNIGRKAFIFNKQKYNLYDGPGVRSMVFFKGCPLRCKWCANPEGLERKFQIMLKPTACVSCGACVAVCPQHIHSITANGEHLINRAIDCIGCGSCVRACMQSALKVAGEQVPVLLRFAEVVDLFLFDIKHMDPERHAELTGVRNEMILDNLETLLQRRHNVKVRMPLLKGINDSEPEIRAVIDFLTPYKDLKNFKGIDLLPYHKLGVNKYTQLGMEYAIDGDPSLSDDDLDRIEGWISGSDFPVTVIRH